MMMPTKQTSQDNHIKVRILYRSLTMDEQFVTITTYEMEPAESITVPAHYSIDEICEAIRSEMAKRGHGQTAQGDDISTIIIASGEFDSHLHPLT